MSLLKKFKSKGVEIKKINWIFIVLVCCFCFFVFRMGNCSKTSMGFSSIRSLLSGQQKSPPSRFGQRAQYARYHLIIGASSRTAPSRRQITPTAVSGDPVLPYWMFRQATPGGIWAFFPVPSHQPGTLWRKGGAYFIPSLC